MMTITRRVEFCASHRLHNPALSDEENRRLYGPCNNPNGHGHNYALEVTVRGSVPERTGMVMDLRALKDLAEEIIVAAVDHRHLNYDVEFLKGMNPTAENLVVKFWERLAPALEGCELHRLRLFESEDNFVEYDGPKGHTID